MIDDTTELNHAARPATGSWKWWRTLLPILIAQLVAAGAFIGVADLSGAMFASSPMCAEMAILICALMFTVLAFFVGAAVFFTLSLVLLYKWRIKNFVGVVLFGALTATLIGWIITHKTVMLPGFALLPVVFVFDFVAFIFWDWFLNVFRSRRMAKTTIAIVICGVLLFWCAL